MAKKTQKFGAPRGQSKAFDLDAHARGVRESVRVAEQHLQIPAGTISSIITDADFIAIVKAYAVVEPLLNDLIATWPPESLVYGNDSFRSFVATLNISGRSGKLKLAQGLRLISDKRGPFILALARIRNRYAHNVKNMHRSLTEILMEEQVNDRKIVENLTGVQDELPLGSVSPADTNSILKLMLYYQLADYLADALKTLRPPPLKGRGFLGHLAAQRDVALLAKGGDKQKS